MIRRFPRAVLLASAAVVLAAPALGQTAANISAANLLSPFITLNNSAAGQGALADNLAATIAINNGASAARQAQAVSDDTQSSNGVQFTSGLGTVLDNAYKAAVANKDASVTTITSGLSTFTAVSGSDSNFNKYFLANGTTNGTTKATGAGLPAGPTSPGYQSTYDVAYGVTAGASGQNPYGDSRPFQARPNDIKVVSQTINNGLGSNPSFPSGHTTFGTTIALLEAMAVPERFSQEIARGLDYGYSRVVLGVHYSMDAIAGRILALHAVADMLNGTGGYATTGGGNYQSNFTSLATTFRNTLATYANTDIASAVKGDSSSGVPVAATVDGNPADRLTYGIRATGDTTLAPVVPTGAEILLATRFPYLTADQRVQVLASTELPSGFALDDGSGWARLDLYRAGMGPAAFNAMATIVQDPSTVAAQYQLFAASAAADTWSNDISGAGGFTHLGSGTLTLTGNNSYAGGTNIGGGTVVAASATALGTGDVVVSGGTLQVTAPTLALGGAYLQSVTAILSLTELGQGILMSVAGNATLAGLLQLDLGALAGRNGLYELIAYGSEAGRFTSVQYSGLAGGMTASLDYRTTGLFLSLSGAVPEPASWAMMVGGFGLLGAMLRRRPRPFEASARGH